MPLVGDIIMSGRELIPDMPQVASPPSAGAMAAVSGGSLPSASYYAVLTVLTPWGESAISNEATVALSGGNHSFSLAWLIPGGITQGLTGLRVYFGTLSGGENQFIEFDGSNNSLSGLATPFTITAPGTPGFPPARSNAYLPDTQGQFINASSIYRWLNEGLNILSRKVKGIQDASGVCTVRGQPVYKFPFKWIKVTNIWFDGWELIKGTRSDIFYRNAITAISNLSVTLKQAESSWLEVFPQPNRTGGQSLTTGSTINPGDVSFTVNNTAGWVLAFGLAQLSNPATGAYEIVAYSSQGGNTFSGLIRGLGGTYAQSWPVGTQVNELNLRVSGFRMANNYTVGSALQIAQLPDGWGDILPIYLESKAIGIQGDKTGGSRKLAEFTKLAQELVSSNVPLQGPVQIGLGSTNEIFNPGLGGGWYLQ